MERSPVTSSNIRALGYEPSSQVLEVEFTNGGIYQYQGVPAKTHAEMVGAKSVGSFFASNIRGKFESKKVGPDER